MIVIDLWDSKQKKLVLSLFLYGEDNEYLFFQLSLIKESKLNIQCGAGIVFDSVPEREWEETINKGMAIIQAYKNLCGEVKWY